MALFTTGRTSEGRQKRRVVYGATKAEALGKLRAIQKQYDAGTLADPSALTVAGFPGRWMDTVGKTKRDTARERRRIYVDKHINPFLGNIRLNKLGLIHLESWLAEMETGGRSDWTRHQAATTLATALKRAVRMRLIPFNPAADLVKPQPKGREVSVYSEEQAKQLLATSTAHRLHAIYALALTSGMREGEILALHWPEVGFEDATVSVVRTLKAKKGGGFTLEPPKSKQSRRTIVLPGYTIDALQDHRKAMLAEGRDVNAGPLFVAGTGNFIGKSNLIRQVHRPLLTRAGLPVYRFHALWRTHASTLLARGRNLREVAERLGHSSPELTLRVYAQLMPGAGEETARMLDRMFGGGL
ncbi:MAG: tyrosine-type recombinase/integrase [Isosphaeraceae bacterium]